MRYMGSKSRVSRHILPIMLLNRKDRQWFVEPFVGGGNSIDKVTGNRIGADIDHYVIEALKLIRDFPERLPKNKSEVDEKEYKMVKQSSTVSCGIRGYYGFALSFGGKWFGGYMRAPGSPWRDLIGESYQNAVKQSKLLKGVKLVCCCYKKLSIPPRSIIYCDPPYASTTKYKSSNFDHHEFWKWCRERHVQGHKIFVSEYFAPEDFICVWEGKIASSLTPTNTGAKYGVERLFTLI